MNYLKKSKDLDNLLILQNKFNLSNDIINCIQDYIYDYKYFKNIWQLRMMETLSILDKGYKLIPTYILPRYNLFNNTPYNIEYYCVECYLEAFIKKKSYVNAIYCNICIQLSYMLLDNIKTYKELSFDEFKTRYEINDIINIYGYRNIKIFLHSNKYLTELILFGNSNCYKSRLKHIFLLYEIKQRVNHLNKKY